MKVLLLFSGGKESVFSLHQLVKQGHDVSLLMFSYQQRSELAESNSLSYYGAKFDLHQRLLPISSMYVPDAIREGTAGDDHVYFRNVIFLSHALNIAMVEKFDAVSVGCTKTGDHGDASTPFYENFRKLIKPMYPNIKIISPTAKYSGYELFGKVMHKDIDNSHLWSCMTSEVKFCGKCSKCQTFHREFESRKFEQFIGYRNYLKFAEKFYGLRLPG